MDTLHQSLRLQDGLNRSLSLLTTNSPTSWSVRLARGPRPANQLSGKPDPVHLFNVEVPESAVGDTHRFSYSSQQARLGSARYSFF